MFRPTRDTPAYYLTSVTKDRLHVFKKHEIADLTCKAIDEARRSGKFLIFAYVIMLDHLHLVTDSRIKSAEVLRFINGIISRRVTDYLKAMDYAESLAKLRVSRKNDDWKYSLWDHHPDARLLWSEPMLWQRIQYTHLNPVRAGFVDHPNEWRWSSARIFHGRAIEAEPLDVDLNKIAWNRR
ncbi:MAG: transposase [Pyrinomonadaceae bacterium]